jgi:hypothetical protein
VLFSIYQILEAFLLGRLGNRHLIASLALLCATAAVLAAPRFIRATRRHHPSSVPIAPSPDPSPSFLMMLMVAGSLAVALIVSPRNNLLLARCLSALMPLLLLLAGSWLDSVIARRSTSLVTYTAAGLIAFSTVTSAFELYELAVRPRSNAREIAAVVRSQMRPDDLLVLVPEWYSASFNHYFPASIEQIDFPQAGRSGMIDFAYVWESRRDTSSLIRFRSRMDSVRQRGRRVWLVVEPKYFRPLTPGDIATAYNYRLPGPLSIRMVHAVLASLQQRYGPPKRMFEASHPKPVYDDLRAYLFSPALSQ